MARKGMTGGWGARFRARARDLAGDRRGLAAVEFMLIMSLLMLVFLAIFSTFFLGVDLLVTRYGAFMGARGLLSGDGIPGAQGDWEEAAEAVGDMAFNVDRRPGVNSVQAVKVCGGDGVELRVQVREYFQNDAMFGGASGLQVSRQCCLGRFSARFIGDNAMNIGSLWAPVGLKKDR